MMTASALVFETALIAASAALAFAAGRLSARGGPAGAAEHIAAQPNDDRFEHLVAELPIAAILVDERGAIRLVNAAAEDVFDVRHGRVEGRALIEAIPSIELERMAATAARGGRVSREISLGIPGRERIVDVRAYPSSTAGETTLLAVDRTRIIALERVRSDFISNVSHELRTPLSAIKLMVETVMLAEGDPEANALFLPQVNREVDRMVQLVEDLLELARSESGRLPLRCELFDLAEFARAVVATVVRRAEAQGTELVVRHAAAVEVFADRNRLTQVLVNLLDNALRHTPPHGSIAVEIDVDGDQAILAVRDTGIGIPYKDLPHIFERFYVVERSRNRDRTGTGLGLSIARQIMEVHGGKISAESDLGRGSTFTCRLPRAIGVRASELANV